MYFATYSFWLMQSVQKRYHTANLTWSIKEQQRNDSVHLIPKTFFQTHIYTHINIFIYSSTELQKWIRRKALNNSSQFLHRSSPILLLKHIKLNYIYLIINIKDTTAEYYYKGKTNILLFSIVRISITASGDRHLGMNQVPYSLCTK